MKHLTLKQWVILFLSFSIFFISCEEDEDINITYFPKDFTQGTLIANEGTMGSGDGSISYYDVQKDEIYNNIFQTINERALGDVVQSITLHNDKAYIVANVSNKIEVVIDSTFKEVGVVTDLSSPRYFIGVSNDKGYVTQWGNSGEVKVINLNNRTVSATITVGAGPERMILIDNYVYVANGGDYTGADNTLSVIDIRTDVVIETIELTGDNPKDVVVDANGKLWVLCHGNITYNPDYSIASQTASKLVQIDPSSNEILQTITIGETLHPTCLETSKNGNNLFYGGGYGFQGIYKMGITETTIPTTPLLDEFFYGFSINPVTGNIFALEAAADYVSNGTLWRYEANGTLLGEYEVGVGPNSAEFYK